ncbi:unnamed protein product [Rotaria sordida]|uniref:TIR domain-containing protein n=1 Tax=Rotaria sordida TaxID=392033 RepID=A0A819JRY3_9BILA|nr:unnamed protein product [Rotaria sordida]
MDDSFEQLVAALAISPLSTTVMSKIAFILKEQICQSISSFVVNSLQSLVTLEHWSWQVLSQDYRRWIDEQSCNQLFDALHSWNIKLISTNDEIQSDTKAMLLIPSKNEWIDGVLDQISTGDDTFVTVASLWFDILAYFVFEQSDVVCSPNIIHISNRLSRDFVMTDQYKSYLQKLCETNISNLNFPFTSQDIIKFLRDDYSEMILVQSNTLNSWNTELLSCVVHLTGLISSACWWGGQKTEHIEMLIPSEDTTHSLILAFIRIVSHPPFHRYVGISRCHLGFLSLSTNDTIQTTTAHLKKALFFVEMCDNYPMIYDILWSLSFNASIQEQLRSNSSFLAKLAKLENESSDSNIRRAVNGILWLLDSNHEDNVVSKNVNNKRFDVMISYSHKDQQICKQVHDKLVQAGYRIWIDFDQMHGNVMDAMAQAIEQSHAIIICMSEHYQRSNFCRAEAQYAFQRKLKMIPILLQKHYKPDGWLSFLISQLLYIDFTKHDFSKAIEILFKELKFAYSHNNATIASTKPKTNHTDQSIPFSSLTQLPSTRTTFPENIRDWTSSHVHSWLLENNLTQMARILTDVDGSSLIYLNEYIMNGEPQQILSLLQQDSHQHANEVLSLVELARFRSLIEKKGLTTLTSVKQFKNMNRTITNSDHSKCCNIM